VQNTLIGSSPAERAERDKERIRDIPADTHALLAGVHEVDVRFCERGGCGE